MKNVVAKYLKHYSHADCALLQQFPAIQFSHSLAIPCFNETPEFAERIVATPFKSSGNILICVVVNQPSGTKSKLNSDLLTYFSAWTALWQNKNLSLLKSPEKNQYWLIANHTRPGLPAKQGVGLARKIAADLICNLWHNRIIDTPWLHCSDADATLPNNYFLPIDSSKSNNNNNSNNSAAVFAFEHKPNPEDPEIYEATLLYEKALNYYVEGLHYAGSNYAFSTIGSALAINLNHYTQVRGFPPRNAAEDFYLLNKLAKVGNIARVNEVKVTLESRISDRVPFGTGPAVREIMTLKNPQQDYRYYAPECFYKLKTWQELIPKIAQNVAQAETLLTYTEQAVVDALNSLELKKILNHLTTQKSGPEQANKTLLDWFDGFRTLKYIRFLQSHHYPAQPLVEILRKNIF